MKDHARRLGISKQSSRVGPSAHFLSVPLSRLGTPKRWRRTLSGRGLFPKHWLTSGYRFSRENLYTEWVDVLSGTGR